MPYLMNHWYAAAWEDELADAPLARTILDQPIVFYRDSAGQIIALQDSCPHRFAPLSLGRVEGDMLVCGYHGLGFVEGGRCARNPHGKGVITSGMAVRSYPIATSHGLIWVWMGDAASDMNLIPALPALAGDCTWVKGRLHVDAHYQLVVDNLLDLTHVEFLHPFLSTPGNSSRTKVSAHQEADRVTSTYDVVDEPVSGLFRLFWTDPADTGNMCVEMTWEAPAVLNQNNIMFPADKGREAGIDIPFIHVLTPETQDSTHYFWKMGRCVAKDDQQLSEAIYQGIQTAFEQEDEPMIRAVRSRMHSSDLLSHRSVALPMDEASIRARRILQRLLTEAAG